MTLILTFSLREKGLLANEAGTRTLLSLREKAWSATLLVADLVGRDSVEPTNVLTIRRMTLILTFSLREKGLLANEAGTRTLLSLREKGLLADEAGTQGEGTAC